MDNNFRMTTKEFSDIKIMCCEGEMDEGCLNYCRSEIKKVVESGFKRIIFDMKNVDYVSSSGWAIFVSSLKNVRNAGGDIKLANLNLRPKHIFALLELGNLIDAYSSVEDAVSAFLKVDVGKMKRGEL